MRSEILFSLPLICKGCWVLCLFVPFFCLFYLDAADVIVLMYVRVNFFFSPPRTLQKLVQSLLVPLQSIQLSLFSLYPVKSQAYSVHFKALCKWPVTLMHCGRWADLDGHVYCVLLKIQNTLEHGLLIGYMESLKCTSLSATLYLRKIS